MPAHSARCDIIYRNSSVPIYVRSDIALYTAGPITGNRSLSRLDKPSLPRLHEIHVPTLLSRDLFYRPGQNCGNKRFETWLTA
jgi:hypothetical protein